MNPDVYTRDEAKAALDWCSVEPQEGELFLVWNTGNKHRYPQIWVMCKKSTYKRLIFTAHQSASIVERPNGIQVAQSRPPCGMAITEKAWNTLRAGGLAVYKGRYIPNDPRPANKKAGKKANVQPVFWLPAGR